MEIYKVLKGVDLELLQSEIVSIVGSSWQAGRVAVAILGTLE